MPCPAVLTVSVSFKAGRRKLTMLSWKSGLRPLKLANRVNWETEVS